jgi:cation transport regulator
MLGHQWSRSMPDEAEILPSAMPGEGTMPYPSNADLPFPVRDHLPPPAQDIYRAAFNHAFMDYSGYPDREEIAHRVAWGAVKRCYVKQCDYWVPRG